VEEYEMKTSFINWLEPIDDGFCALIALTLNNTTSFEAVYWFNEYDETLSIDPELLMMFEVDYEEDLEFYYELLDDIKSILPEEFHKEVI
jgi:hypothetical protein